MKSLTNNKIVVPRKAIIIAAGFGTRFLPATKAVPKEMLPIVDKPIIQYHVEELANSGVEKIVLITRKDGRAIEDHFDCNSQLESQLSKAKKLDLLKMIRKTNNFAEFIHIRQKLFMPYGTATPLIISSDFVKNEPFFYLYGDDLVKSSTPFCQKLVDIYKANPDAALIMGVQKVPWNEVSRYGIVKIKQGTKNIVETIVEKPKRNEAPSNLVSFGRFLFTPKILPIVKKLKKGKNKELCLVDAIKILAEKEKVIVCESKEEWLTTGDPFNYLKANIEFALDRNDLKKELRHYLVKRLKHK